MIIRRIEIENFRSYYGNENIFEFGDGLTLIIGDNGDGKSTFFEALQWLLDISHTDEVQKSHALDNFSEMRKSKLEIGESANLRVKMDFEHDGRKSVEKMFVITRKGEDHFDVSDIKFKGKEETDEGRLSPDGRKLIARCFDAEMQHFSMFKGESRLDVLDGPEALKMLVDKYSDIKYFDELVNLTSNFESSADKAFRKESKNDEKTRGQATVYDNELTKLSGEILGIRKEITELSSAVKTYENMLKDLEQNQDTRDRYNELSQNLATKKSDATSLKASIEKVNLNTSLLDQYWIMCAFPSILSAFKDKCAKLSREKERLRDEFIFERGKEQGELNRLKQENEALLNDEAQLPWYMPDDRYMEEMIKVHRCKVCNTPAPEGSDAYRFMVNKLNEYKKHISERARIKEEQIKLSKKQLFTEEYIDEINVLANRLSGPEEASIAGIANDINNRLEVVRRKSEELSQVKKDIEELEEDISRLLIQAGNISEEMMKKNNSDVNNMFRKKGEAELEINNLKHDLDEKEARQAQIKKEMDNLKPGNSLSRLYQKVHIAFDQISKASKRAKETNLYNFLNALKKGANLYMDRLSTKDFHGEVHLFYKKDTEEAGIRLKSSNGTYIKKPSDSQKTVMYISILFAVSDFAYKKTDEEYPLIFDAATSSFGDAKEEDFYNIINDVNKQCIVITKDFITGGKVRMNDVDKLTCRVYRIQKADGFNNSDLSTIRTLVKEIKTED
jgi:DNA sulfur modification protein DndD